MIIAIDGPAASGKGTLARRLAAHYGLAYLDTGALYRVVAMQLLRAGAGPENTAAAVEAANNLDMALMNDPDLRAGGTGQAASVVAAMPDVRQAVLDLQRRFAAQPGGAVLDGRDIGTVVCPDADVKLYVIASDAVRAERRHAELVEQGEAIEYDRVLSDLRARDARDGSRTTAPMRPADNALLLDTSDLDIETAFLRAIEMVESLRNAK